MPKPLFLGRTQELQYYQEFLCADSPWLLVITGLGGCGKSALLRKMKEQTPPGMAVVKLDFAGEAQRHKSSLGEQLPIDPLTRLYEFASQIRGCCDVQAYDSFSTRLTQTRQHLLDQRVPTYIGHLTQDVRLAAEATMQDTHLVMGTTEDPTMQDIRREARAIATLAFYPLLDTFQPDHLIIMLDTCEWLVEPVNAEIGLWIQEFLLTLHNRLQQRQKQCHVVVASSVELRLKAIAEQDQDFLSLPALDEIVVQQHLEILGIRDPELRRRVYQITNGHASCVSILCQLWQTLRREEKPLSVAELLPFQRRFYEWAVNKFIDEHIFDERLKSPFDKLTRYGILLRRFNLYFLKKVFHEVLVEQISEKQALEYFNQFVRRPYIKSLQHNNYVLLELLRAALAESIRANEPDAWERYHKRALDFLTSLPKTTSVHSSDWYYHALASKLAYDEEPGMTYWQETLRELETLGSSLDALLEAAHDETLMFTSIAHAAHVYEQKRSS